MAYTPTSDDIAEFMQQDTGNNVPASAMPATNQTANGYTPSASDINAMDPSLAPPRPFYQNILPDIMGPIAGAGQSLANVFLPEKYQKHTDFSKVLGVSTPGTFDKILQTAAAYAPYSIGAGGAVGAAAKMLPELGPAAANIGSMIGGSPRMATALSDFLGGTAFSAQNDPQKTAMQNLGSGALMAGIGQPFGMAADAMRAIRGIHPQDMAKNIMGYLGRGSGIEENNAAIASASQDYLKNKEGIASSIYNPIHDKYGDSPIYGTKYEGISAQKVPISADEASNSDFNSLSHSQIQSASPNLYANFIKNPTFQNAHLLQSDLGTTIRNMPAKLGTADQAIRKSLSNGRDSLLSDMNSFLAKTDKNAADQYNTAKNYFYENVAPARHPDISSLTTGKVKNPTNSQIISTFKNPEPAIQKIIDESPEIADRVLFAKLSSIRNINDPKVMQNTIADLDRQGLTSSITQPASQMFNQLNSSIKRNNFISHVLGAVGGFGLGKVIPAMGEHLKEALPIAGGLLGSGITRKNINPLSPEFLDKLNDSFAARGLSGAVGSNIIARNKNQDSQQ